MNIFQNINSKALLCVGMICYGISTPLSAKVVLPALFTSNMVVQQKTTMKLFGEAAPGKNVTVTTGWNNKQYETLADEHGKWNVEVSTPKAGGHYRITLSDGEETVLDNIMSGEVWFCSGQSNMEMPVAGWGKIKNYEQEIAAANYPNIRLFQVKKHTAAAPTDQLESNMGGWQPCSPNTVPEFSSLAYLYARELHRNLNIPIGVIDCTWGGTPAEAWTSAEGLKNVMGFQDAITEREALGFNRESIMEKYNLDHKIWQKKCEKKDRGLSNGKECWIATDVDDSQWPTMNIPGNWEWQGLNGLDGIVWFRKSVMIPAEWAGKDLQLNPGCIDDEDITYWNGVKVGQGWGYTTPRHYTVPGHLVKAGLNVIAIKDTDNGGEGGITGDAHNINVSCGGQTIALAGEWKYNIGVSLTELPKAPDNPEASGAPSALFNGMVHPCLSYPIKGVIWYQGCNNVGFAEQYECLFQSLITDWRKQFNNPDMPFYFVQLANYLQRKDVQHDSQWAALREAQSKAQHLAHTGMVTNIDLGEANDIHPKNKQEVARRLGALSLADTYGKKIPAQAPVYKDNIVEGSNVRIRFTLPAIGEKFVQDKDIKGFTLAGPDRKFYPAQAHTEGEEVVVSSPYVSQPVAVRYGWADNPECTLQTPSELHVAPFRSDNWPYKY